MNDKEKTMACPTDEELSALLDGDLEAGRRAEVDAHLEACAACREARDGLSSMLADLSSLADEEPGRDLWPAIQRAHEHEAGKAGGLAGWFRRFWSLPAMAAAGAAAALLIVWMVGGMGGPGPAPTGKPLKALAAVQSAEQTYVDAVAALERELVTDKQNFSPEVQATIEQGLADIDKTLDRCRQALRAAPEDLGAHQAMLAAYQHKVDFLTELLGETM